MNWRDILKETIHGGRFAAKHELDTLIEQGMPKYREDKNYLHENLRGVLNREFKEKYDEIYTDYFTDKTAAEKKLFDGIKDLRIEVERTINSLPKQSEPRRGDLGTYPEGEPISGRTQRLGFDEAMRNNP